jgi:hypothetical protein
MRLVVVHGGIAITLGLVLAGLFVAGYLPLSYAVALSGTAVNITIEGRGAGRACRGEFRFTQGGSAFATTPIEESPFGDIVWVAPSAKRLQYSTLCTQI